MRSSVEYRRKDIAFLRHHQIIVTISSVMGKKVSKTLKKKQPRLARKDQPGLCIFLHITQPLSYQIGNTTDDSYS